MALHVEPSPPPSLSPETDTSDYDDIDVQGGDYRREELETYLHDGAWEQSFSEWASQTDLTEEEYAIVRDLGLIEEFDFFWDSFAERVGYHAPGIPEDWEERDLHPSLTSWAAVSSINASLTELGQVVCDVLKEEYIDWETEYEAPDDLPDYGSE